MQPVTLRSKRAIQVSYDVPQTIYSAQVYPLTATNGSTIVLCGLETGLRIIWRGGRPFKSHQRAPSGNPTTNGVSSPDVMVIDDSDDEAPTSEAASKPAEFEEQYEEVDFDEPYETILRQLDIPTSSVISLSIPHVPSNLRELPDGAYPPIYKDRMVIAAVCKDFTVILVTVPLSPPSPAVTNASAAGVQIVKLGGHHDLPGSVTVTHTSDDVELRPESRSRSRSRQAEESAMENKEWSLLIASTSPSAGGILLLHEVSVVQNALQTHGSGPVQRQHLRSGTSCKVLFNPSVSPHVRHSNLLVLYPSGVVKVYQCIQESHARHSRGRRGSNATMDSMASKSSTHLSGGKFLVTLYSPFALDDDALLPRRKNVLDVSWIFGGAAILALLDDGSWGIWDLEGAVAESSTKSQNLIQGQTHQTLLSGRTLTQLSVRGRFSSTDEAKSRESEAKLKTTKLAPMTPHTRKVRSDGLFTAGSTATSSSGLGLLPRGGIFVSPQNARAPSSEESVLIYYGKQNLWIPNLPSYIRNSTTAKSPADAFETSSASRVVPIEFSSLSPDLRQIAVSQLPPSHRPSPATSQPTLAFAANLSVPDILLTTPHHLIFLCRPIEEPGPPFLSEEALDRGSFEADVTFRQTLDFPSHEDQLLLRQGELDIDGMGRIMDGMNKRGGGFMEGTPTKQRATSAGRNTGTGRREQATNGAR